MGEVVVISESIVKPESYEDGVKIHLTPFDLVLLRSQYAHRALIFPQPDSGTNIISKLKSSLSVALKIYYPFAGRLVKIHNKDDETASFYIDCDGSGVRFLHASATTVSVSDVLDPAKASVPDFWNAFFPLNRVQSWEGVSKPLFAFQVTELKDGVFIGYSHNHMVADGISLWNFYTTLTKICCSTAGGFDRTSLPLCGWFLDGIDYPIRVPISETVSPPPVEEDVVSRDIRKKTFRFTTRSISELKEKANAEVVGSDVQISSFQAVVGHMWRSVIRNSDLNPEEVIHCKFGVDIRQRLNPPMDKECFGNVAGRAYATTTAGEMVNNGLGWAALHLNKTVRSQTNQEFKRFAENWVKNPKIPNPVMVKNMLDVGSSPRFNVFGTDFGWGKPIAVRPGPGIARHGKILVYPGPEQGSMEIHTSLWSHVLEKLLADEEFLQHVVPMC